MYTTATSPNQNKVILIFKSGIVLLSIALSSVFSSCKKEYIDWPYNDIEKFAVKDDTGQELKALIQDGTILLSWPPFQTAPDSIAPEIIVSDRATISPASGTKVALEDGLTYQVTAQDGSTKTYTLKVASSQPKPSFIFKSNSDVQINSTIAIQGEYFLPDANQTTLHLVGPDKNEFPITFDRLTTSSAAGIVPISLDTGKYVVKFKTGIYTFANATVNLTAPALKATVNQASSTSVKRGGELILDITDSAVEAWWASHEVGYATIISQSNVVERIEVSSPVGQIPGIIKFAIPADLTSVTQIKQITQYDKNGVLIAGSGIPRLAINVTD